MNLQYVFWTFIFEPSVQELDRFMDLQYLKNPSKCSLADVPDVNDIVPGKLQLLQLRIELGGNVVVVFVRRQFVQIDVQILEKVKSSYKFG